MTPAERRALLGDDLIEHIHSEVDAAITEAPPTPEVLAALRRIFARPAGRAPVAGPGRAA